MTEKLNLSEIVLDAGTQVRSGLNETTVADYAEALADGAKFPPMIVFHDGQRYVAADGFHRISATLRLRMRLKFLSLIATSQRRRVSSVFFSTMCSITSCQVRVVSFGSVALR